MSTKPGFPLTGPEWSAVDRAVRGFFYGISVPQAFEVRVEELRREGGIVRIGGRTFLRKGGLLFRPEEYRNGEKGWGCHAISQNGEVIPLDFRDPGPWWDAVRYLLPELVRQADEIRAVYAEGAAAGQAEAERRARAERQRQLGAAAAAVAAMPKVTASPLERTRPGWLARLLRFFSGPV